MVDSHPDERLISNHVAAAAVAAAIPIPLVDLVAVTAVQLALVRSLARRHGADVGIDAAGAVGVGLFGALLPRVAASALKIVPGIGTVGGAVAQCAFSGATTWAIAESLRERLERGSLHPDARAPRRLAQPRPRGAPAPARPAERRRVRANARRAARSPLAGVGGPASEARSEPQASGGGSARRPRAYTAQMGAFTNQ